MEEKSPNGKLHFEPPARQDMAFFKNEKNRLLYLKRIVPAFFDDCRRITSMEGNICTWPSTSEKATPTTRMMRHGLCPDADTYLSLVEKYPYHGNGIGRVLQVNEMVMDPDGHTEEQAAATIATLKRWEEEGIIFPPTVTTWREQEIIGEHREYLLTQEMIDIVAGRSKITVDGIEFHFHGCNPVADVMCVYKDGTVRVYKPGFAAEQITRAYATMTLFEKIKKNDEAYVDEQRKGEWHPSAKEKKPEQIEAELEYARMAAKYIPLEKWGNSADWETIMMAFAHAFGMDGWPLFDELSSRIERYNNETKRAENLVRYKSCLRDVPKPITIASYYWLVEWPGEPPKAPRAVLPSLTNAFDIDETTHPHLAEFVELFTKWSPRSPIDFHINDYLFLVSTINAGRTFIPFRKKLLLAYWGVKVAWSSLYAKSEGSDMANQIIRDAGLDYLLLPDRMTPEYFMEAMSTSLPKSYIKMEEDEQKVAEMAMQLASSRGWSIDEMGVLLKDIFTPGSLMATMHGVLLAVDGQKPYIYATKTNGISTIKEPFLAINGNMTPWNIAALGTKSIYLWGEGLFPRLNLVTAPDDFDISAELFPEGLMVTPPLMMEWLIGYDKELGCRRDVKILDDVDARTSEDVYKAKVGSREFRAIGLPTEIHQEMQAYSTFLFDIMRKEKRNILNPNISRLPSKAVINAGLFASMEKRSEVTNADWDLAKRFAERTRVHMRQIYDDAASVSTNGAPKRGDPHLQYIHKNKPTKGAFRNSLKAGKREDVDVILQAYIDEGFVVKNGDGSKATYDTTPRGYMEAYGE